jgi:hypothetical protein
MSDARGPMSPRPNTAEPSETTTTSRLDRIGFPVLVSEIYGNVTIDPLNFP